MDEVSDATLERLLPGAREWRKGPGEGRSVPGDQAAGKACFWGWRTQWLASHWTGAECGVHTHKAPHPTSSGRSVHLIYTAAVIAAVIPFSSILTTPLEGGIIFVLQMRLRGVTWKSITEICDSQARAFVPSLCETERATLLYRHPWPHLGIHCPAVSKPPSPHHRMPCCAGEWWAIGWPGNALNCSVCHFLWCKCSHHCYPSV